ncbi:MAG: LCP family protein [Chloroflexota bacterium]
MESGSRSRTRPVRSAFAAAFLSFLFPGLGHAYLGRWLRAVMWATLPILAIAAAAGLLVGPNRTDVLSSLIDPDVLLATLGILIIDLLYRLAALIDAWRLARAPSVGSVVTRTLSKVGVVAVTLVLVVSHIAMAQPVMFAYDTISSLTGEGGDTSAIPTIDDLGPEFANLLELALPTSTSGAATVSPEPAIPSEYEWDGKKRLDILLVGVDSGRKGGSTFLTDTLMVVSVDPVTRRLALISLPRDTAAIPLPRRWGAARRVIGRLYDSKINTLYTTARIRSDLFPGNDRQRGYRALMGALSELYGLDIKYYVSVDLRSFRGAVNAIGGLSVNVRTPLFDAGYPSNDGRGKLKLYVAPGIQSMNGAQALAYARSRKSTSDFDRAARQQLLIASVRDQLDIGTLLAPGVIERLSKQFRQYIKTNIPARLLPKLLVLARSVNLDKRKSLVLSSDKGYSRVCDQCQADRQWKLIADIPKIRKAVQGVFKTSKERARER